MHWCNRRQLTDCVCWSLLFRRREESIRSTRGPFVPFFFPKTHNTDFPVTPSPAQSQLLFFPHSAVQTQWKRRHASCVSDWHLNRRCWHRSACSPRLINWHSGCQHSGTETDSSQIQIVTAVHSFRAPEREQQEAAVHHAGQVWWEVKNMLLLWGTCRCPTCGVFSLTWHRMDFLLFLSSCLYTKANQTRLSPPF